MKQQKNMRNEENIDQIARSKRAITIYFREPTKTHKNEFAFEINNWFIIGKI